MQIEGEQNTVSTATLTFSILHLMVKTILTQYRRVKDLIDMFEKPRTKLTFRVRVRDQICSLQKKKK